MEQTMLKEQDNREFSTVKTCLSLLQLPITDNNLTDTSLWNQAITNLKQKISNHNVELWIDPIIYLSMDEDFITLQAPNTFIRDWFEIHYLPILIDEIHSKVGSKKLQVLWLIKEQEVGYLVNEKELSSNQPKELLSKTPALPEPEFGMFTHYTFNHFVVGPSNQLAEAASKTVANSPSVVYNPFFIYGGAGLGKTHLLCAIGHEIKKQHPHWNVVYLKTESFINEYIYALRTQKIDEFRRKYRELPDVLLVDDIQYLKGKERTQDEFFHTFNALFEQKKQIVLTADRYPHEISDIESRLLSRFQWGLTADIQPPDLETRLAILLQKADEKTISLSIEVAQFLALHIRSNVRELEGALTRLAAFANLKKVPLSIDLAKETLKTQLSYGNTLSVESVQQEVARHFHVQVSDLKSSSRKQSLAKPRQIAMHLARKLCQASYPELGEKFGGKDHTTVMAAYRKVDSLNKSDLGMRQLLLELETRLKSAY